MVGGHYPKILNAFEKINIHFVIIVVRLNDTCFLTEYVFVFDIKNIAVR